MSVGSFCRARWMLSCSRCPLYIIVSHLRAIVFCFLVQVSGFKEGQGSEVYT